MADLATIADVESRWRPLIGQQRINAQTWLTDASGILRDEIPTIDDKCTASESYARRVAWTVAMAVRRLLRGMDKTDPATWDSLFFFPAELAGLESSSGGTGAFTITPSSDGPGYRTDSDSFGWA